MARGPGNFVAIDFETANYDSNSACEVGLVRVVAGKIVAEHSFLIRPPTNNFVPRFIDLHGISWADVRHAPIFSELWQDIRRIFKDASFLTAHNASFDRRVLASVCSHYGISPPNIPFVCSMTTARDLWSIRPTKLPDVCKALKIPFRGHHRALNDARACAEIIIRAHSDGVRRTPVKQTVEGEQLELLPKTRKAPTARKSKKLAPVDRRKQLGDWGEKKVLKLLYQAGFEHVENLNDRVSNHPFADLLAQRQNQWFLIGVKTRNKMTAQGRLNSAYNVRKKGKDLMPLAKEYDAILAWVTISVEAENQKYSAFFGTIDEIEDKGERFSIPMTEEQTANYECFVRNKVDRSIQPEWSNQPKPSVRKTQTRKPSKQMVSNKTNKIKFDEISSKIGRKLMTNEMTAYSSDRKQVDHFGFSGKRACMACLYSRPEGASQREVNAVAAHLGSPQKNYLNMLTQALKWRHNVFVWKDKSRGGNVWKLVYNPIHGANRASEPPSDYRIRNKICAPNGLTGKAWKTKTSLSTRVRRRVKAHRQEKGDIANAVLGFRPGTKTHRAISMYLRTQGATSEDIIKVNGGPYLNCLKQVEAMGHTVERKMVAGRSGRLITSYRIILKS